MSKARPHNFLYIFFLIFIFPFNGYANPSQSNITQPYGLFFIEANQLQEDEAVFAAPTLKTDVQVDIQGLLSTTTVKQYFINPTNAWMEAVYLFPLPDKSAVDFLRMKIGDRFIEGEIQEKIKAENTYDKAKKNGQKTTLVSSSRSNIFKTKIANIAPGELIVVEIRYHDVLVLQNNIYSLRIPTVINHRYTHSNNTQEGGNVLDQVELNPAIHSPINTGTNYTINPYAISVNLNTGFDITLPDSSHTISVDSISSSHYKIALDEGTMPSTSDFILNFSPIKSPEPYIEIYGEDVDNDVYLYGLINPQIEKKDLFLIEKTAITIVADVSGSMSGNSLRKMQGALIAFINQLPEKHNINIIAFDDYHYKLFNHPKPLTVNTKQQALRFVRNLEAKGGTNMFPAVYEAIFEKSVLPMKHQIVLMTDGAIGYEAEMMAIVHEHIGDKRFHIVGIGSAPNAFFIKGLAQVGNGSYLYVNDNIKEKITTLLYKINHPVLENLKIVLSQQHEVLPKQFPDVLANDPITFFIKIPQSSMANLIQPFTIKGNQGSKPWSFSVMPDQIQQGKNLDQLWAREKINSLSFKSGIGFLDSRQYEHQVTKLGLKHHLITNFTSLVAVDPLVSRSQSSPLISHQIAHNIPAGWEDPEIVKKSQMMQKHYKELNQAPIDVLYKVNLNTSPTLKVNFVQTATNKNLFLLFAIVLFGCSFYLMRIHRRLV